MLWFNWKLSVCTLQVWEKRPVFHRSVLGMEFFILLHTARPSRLLPTSGQLEDRGGLLKIDCPAQHLRVNWSAKAAYTTPVTLVTGEEMCSFVQMFFFHILDYFWSLKSSLR